MRSIRGGKGLGDALYVQAVARHLVSKGERLEVCTSWPDVFRPLGNAVKFSPFRRERIDVLAHYSMRKVLPTRQWPDVCAAAKVPLDTPLLLDWQRTGDLGESVRRRAGLSRIVAVQMPRAPMDRKDGFGAELMPDLQVIQRLINEARARGCFMVQIGSGRALHRFDGIDVDLSSRTTVCELLDVALEVDAFLGYVSFIVPLAESLNKPALLVWSRRGLKAPHAYVRQITPQKVLEKPTSRAVFDDASDAQLMGAISELL